MTRDNQPFRTPIPRYEDNMSGSALTYAKAVVIGAPETDIAGVGIFRGKFLIGVLTPEDAIKVADQLIDATESPVIQ